MKSKDQYLKQLLKKYGGYHTKSKKVKGQLLDEYCETTGENRKYVINKIRSGSYLREHNKTRSIKRKRTSYYGGDVKIALIRMWEIFDQPCGQRLEVSLRNETDRMRELNELDCSDDTAKKLKQISARTCDRKLKNHKEKEHLKRKYNKKQNPLLYQEIPVKLSDEWDRSVFGNIQIDLVEHCGQSSSGQYICTLSTTDIATGWWEGEAVMGKAQERTTEAVHRARKRYPFLWGAVHSDNGREFINHHLYRYTQKEELSFSRSRPYKKNDNCFAEQKNSTHVKRYVGCLRYDTKKEQKILNGFYRNELRFYKNFFQPQIKLKRKVRIKGKIKRKYYKAKTPYQRAMKSNQVSDKTKKKLKQIYEKLNPAELKRAIDKKLNLLCEIYKAKNNSQKVKIDKKLVPFSVSSLDDATTPFSVR